MIRNCKKNGFRTPIWVEKENVLRLTFPGIAHAKKNEGVNEGVNLDIEGVNEGVKQELQQVLQYLRSNPMKKTSEIAAQIDKGVSTIERYLKLLKENNLIEFVGAPKTGGYKILN